MPVEAGKLNQASVEHLHYGLGINTLQSTPSLEDLFDRYNVPDTFEQRKARLVAEPSQTAHGYERV